MTINEKALEIAITELDAGAGEIGDNNSGPFVEKYLNHLIDPPANWCMAFVSWCFKEASKQLGIKMPFPYSLGAKKSFNYFNKKGWIKKENPWPGDIIFFWRVDENSWEGHAGIVETGNRDDNGVYLITIEGNKGGFPAKVHRWSYDWFNVPQLLGYGRIK